MNFNSDAINWDHYINQIGSFIDILSPISYIAGFICGFQCLMAFKEANENPRVGLRKAIILFICSALFLSIPELIGTLAETLAMKSHTNVLDTSTAKMFDARFLWVIFFFLKGVGIVYIIKGVFVLKEIGEQNKQGLGWKVIWHMLGGMCLFHLQYALGIFAETLNIKL